MTILMDSLLKLPTKVLSNLTLHLMYLYYYRQDYFRCLSLYFTTSNAKNLYIKGTQ